MVAVTIISLLASLAVPLAKRSQMATQAAAIASDLRTFAAAFDGYAQEKGAYPAETDPGVLPPEMQERLGNRGWERVTPMGGQYNWENNQLHNGVRYRAAICISASPTAPLTVNADMLRAIDKIIDDGDLNTGNFRTGVNDDALFIIAQ